ncbi:MAG TPA: septation protein SepH [Natronosporangium sp.]
MRPVRFVALSEDGQALVLADEVGRLLALPRDERVMAALRGEGKPTGTTTAAHGAETPSLSPRDIQARIRAGESADDVARIAGVAVDRVLRYAGPVLQERAMLAQHARRTRLKTSETGASLAEVVDSRLAQHGVDAEKISWDAYRRDDGTWRVVATWPSGKATAQAVWELDKARTLVTPFDDMAQYLCAERPTQILGQEEPPTEREPRRSSRGKLLREPSRGGHGLPTPAEEPAARPAGRDPIRSGRDALLASLDRPLGAAGRGLDAPAAAAAIADTSRGSGRTGRGVSPFEDDSDAPKEVPAVPSLAVLRPRRTTGNESGPDSGRKRGPSWDEVLFGAPPAARESS